MVAVLAALIVVPTAASRSTGKAPAHACQTLVVSAGGATIVPTSIALTRAMIDGPDRDAAYAISASGLDCATAWRALETALPSGQELLSLQGQGYTVAAQSSTERLGRRRVHEYEVHARGGGGELRYVRFGPVPTVPYSYRAGNLIEIRTHGNHSSGCTANVVVRWRHRLWGVTAGHCGRHRGKPVLGWVANHLWTSIGTVEYPLGSYGRPPDAMVFSLGHLSRVTQTIARPGKPPLTVTGWLSAAEQRRRGGRACASGATTGRERCGRITHVSPNGVSSYACTTIPARPGDSGGPVYTDPGTGTTTQVLGIMSTKDNFRAERMCYQPLDAVMGKLDGARLPRLSG